MKKLVLLPVILLFLCTCKKKEDPTEEPVVPPVTQPTGTYSGVFSAEKMMFWAGGQPMSHVYLVRVFLHSTLKTESALYSQGDYLGVVKSNGIQLQYNNSLRYYRDSTTQLSYSAQVSFQHTSTAMGSINYTSA